MLNRYRLIAKHDSWRQLIAQSPWLAWYEFRLWAYLLCVEPRALHLVWAGLRQRAEPGSNAWKFT